MDMMEAYTEKPVQKEGPGETEEQAAEETTQTLQEEAGEEEQSEEETWGDREGPSKHLTLRELGMERYLSDMRTQLREMKEKLEVKDEQLKRTEDQLREKDEQQEALQRQLTTLRAEKETKEKESAKFQEQLGIKLKELTDLEKEFRDSVQDQVDLKRDLSAAKEKLSKYESQLMTRDWIISRHEIEIMTDRSLGEGGYGMVFKGRYRGFVVAVKTLKDFTLNAGGRDLFEREMDIASRCRHPCLLQFIGATQDETPLLVTELMELSLRKLLRERQLSEKEIVVISLDVAHALNYLHNRKIVHRDVSSANVLLWKQNDQWRGKLGDYGTVKFLQEVMTKSPGAMIYSAPEAGSPFNQTVKIDVYSFGVLFCEMFTTKIPFSYERKKHVDLVPNRPGGEFQDLVLWCTEEDPARRPSMETVIKRLETFITTI
ncbi:dual specificity protein kinase shkB-like [Porites lutea]|uniref:dual specificity protein kinase shkB-like n=1 Tax=Porites lutea TaxID=51062 RepID=UPI003CC69D1F